ncbi:MAG: bifunctional riboflavin kinase/FAD synthetase [Verrucomicrobia bacterium]|nr:bifunctional riboflavin kinase/FAD synthetase [Verrucomicrobiota bacterium]MBS0647244.1 bifunctional riboflavin kinase/FAD synthetase [Verrucomicrobiota bacterium]
MDPFQALRHLRLPKGNLDLTIGNFDGVHIGHKKILQSLNPHRVVLTFLNHPQSVLTGQSPPLLTLPEHKINLIKELQVQTVCQIPFTPELAKMEARSFLISLRSVIPFSRLILGHDAVIGYQRQGSAQHLLELASELGFALTYLPAVALNAEVVSSSVIRKALTAGQLDKVQSLLGRPYSIQGRVCPGAGMGRILDCPTANLDISQLALPPFGVYAVWVKFAQQRFKALANLGCAPTLQRQTPVLEVHLLEHQEDLYGKEIEVSFLDFLRPEQRFPSLQALKEQIQQDILKSRTYFVTSS